MNVVERHGCLVCGRIFEVLAVYNPNGGLMDCKVTSPGGHCVANEHQPLAACDTHSPDAVEAAYKKWQSRKNTQADPQENE